MAARLWDDPADEERISEQLEHARRRRETFSATATEDLALRTAEIRRAAGTGTASLALAKSGRTGADPLVAKVGAAAAQRKQKKGFGLHTIGDVLKGASRVTFTALEAPLQELQGVIRNIATMGEGGRAAAGAGSGAALGAGIGSIVPGAGTAVGAGLGGLIGGGVGLVGGLLAPEVEGEAEWQSQSTAGVAIGKALAGDKVDLGAGLFAGGKVREEQSKRARQVQVGGHALTPGRFLASAVLEPGTAAYNIASGLVDAGIALKVDPAAAGLSQVKKANQARRLFVTEADAAGLVSGTRKTVITDRVAEWLDSTTGQKVVDRLASTSGTRDVWRLLGKKVNPELAAKLADAPDARAVRSLLEPELGVTLREKPQLPGLAKEASAAGFRAVFRRDPSTVRALQAMPGGRFLLDDKEQAVNQMERFLQNARMPSERVDHYVDALARATTPTEQYRVVVTEMMGEVMGRLAGSTPAGTKAARKLTTAWQNNYQELTKYFVDEIGENIGLKQVTVGGRQFDVPTPHLWNEYIHTAIPSPDARAIRRATAGGTLWNKAVNSGAFDVTTNVLDFVSQDVWKPFALLRGAWTVRVVGEEQVRMAASGLDSMVSHPMRAISWAIGRAGQTDVLGQDFDALDDATDFARALSQRGGGWRDRIVSHGKTIFRRDDDIDGYVKAWQGELGQLAADPVAKVVAGGPPAGSVSTITGNHVDDAKRWFWEGKGQKFRLEMAEASGRQDLLDPTGAEAYIDSVFQRIRIKTSDDARLIDAIATGRFEGQPLADGTVRTSLEAIALEGIGPSAAKGDIVLAGRPNAASNVGGYLNTATDHMFDILMSRPTNFLSRSPAFKQHYYQRLQELVPFMDDAAKQAAIDGARAAGVDVAGMQRLAARGSGDLSLEDADTIAKGFGLDRTKKLLYDLSEKSQAADITRVIFPFAEAWKEILTTWARIGVIDNPAAVRRIQQGIQGARGAGFFTRDEATGEEVFTYPGTGFIIKKLTGVDAPLQGSAAALNLFSSNPFIPGFGPAVQFPMSKIIPDKPEWDTVRELFVPFGEPDTSGGVIESYLPPWVQKWRKAIADPESDRTFANTVMDVSRYLVGTGEYSADTVEEQERLSAAAVQKARLLYMIRGAAQWVAPSAPRPEFLAHDKDGRLVTAFKLTEEYRRLQDENYETATQRFLDTYGEDALLYMQPKSRGGFNPSDSLHEWVRSNPDLAGRYPQVYGYFAPGGGEFSMKELERQVAVGERENLSPEEAVRLSNARVAALKYRQAREAIGPKPTKPQQAWLRDLRDALVTEYPGYEPEHIEMGRTDVAVRQLYAAAGEEAVARTDAGRGLATYLKARDQALAAAKEQGLATFARAKSMRRVRDWLREVGSAVSEEHPDFAPIFDRILEREMVDDTPEVTDAQQ